MKKYLLILVAASGIFSLAPKAEAIIMTGPEGAPHDQGGILRSQPDLHRVLREENLPEFPYWDHFVYFGGGSAVALGMDASGYLIVVSSGHMNSQPTLDWKGHTFELVDSIDNIDGQDIRMSRLVPTLPVLENIPTVPVRKTEIPLGTRTLNIGAGYNRKEITLPAAGYYTTALGYISWGLNHVTYVGSGTTRTKFDIGNRYDSQLAMGDSGSPLFTVENGKWVFTSVGRDVTDIYQIKDGDLSNFTPAWNRSSIQSLVFTEIDPITIPPVDPPATAPAAGPLLMGMNVNPGDMQRAKAWQEWTGTKPDIIGDGCFYLNWPELHGNIPGAGLAWTIERHSPKAGQPANPYKGNTLLELGIPMFPNQDLDGTPFSQIPDRYSRAAGGAYDSHWEALATELVDKGLGNSWIRPGCEFNIRDNQLDGWDNGGSMIGDSSNEKMKDFATYWRRIHRAMMKVPGANFKWSWCVLIGVDGPDGFTRLTTHAWPGNNYVDHVSCDLYDGNNYVRYWRGHWQGAGGNWFLQPSDPVMDERTWEILSTGTKRNTGIGGAIESVVPALDAYKAFANRKGKKMILSEWGIVDSDRGQSSNTEEMSGGNDNPDFIAEVAKWSKANNLHAMIYFEFHLNRQVPAYGEADAINHVDHTLLPNYWNNPANTNGNPVHTSANPHPRASAAYLKAFHNIGSIPASITEKGRTARPNALQILAGGNGPSEPNTLIGTGWQQTYPGAWISTKAASANTAIRYPSFSKGGSLTVTAETQASEPNQWVGITALGSLTQEGYKFEARCGSDGLPNLWKLSFNGTQLWSGSRPALLTKTNGQNWRNNPIPMGMYIRSGPSNSLRIKLSFGADTPGDINLQNQPAFANAGRAGITASSAGATADLFNVTTTTFDEDFNDGHQTLEGNTGWVTERTQLKAPATNTEKSAWIPGTSLKLPETSTRISIRNAGRAGVWALQNPTTLEGYRIELETYNPTGIYETRHKLKALRLFKKSGEFEAKIQEWIPATGEIYQLGSYHDLKTQVELTNSYQLKISVTFDGNKRIEWIDNNPVTSTGRTGLWASANTEAWIDNLTVFEKEEAFLETKDEWALRNFGNLYSPNLASRDDDGDGQSNEDEYTTGTNPKDPNSKSILHFSLQGANAQVAWESMPLRSYQLETSEDLKTWNPQGAKITGTGAPMHLLHPASGEKMFFRMNTNLAN